MPTQTAEAPSESFPGDRPPRDGELRALLVAGAERGRPLPVDAEELERAVRVVNGLRREAEGGTGGLIKSIEARGRGRFRGGASAGGGGAGVRGGGAHIVDLLDVLLEHVEGR